ncbi:endoplasmic reticulum lectin 1-like [Watersipora subatra]|uniref:endoplasmic reticulum lectin 1-like n=1 Tax=Watersipora subatra TaxID=2589382 RepID=UPI00355C7450
MVTSLFLPKTIILLCVMGHVHMGDIDPFADSIPFAIEWSGPATSAENQLSEDTVILPMITKDQQRYECHYVANQLSTGVSSKAGDYSGPSAKEILEAFATTTACSYRVESFWTYELCHFKRFRQFHEERNPKSDNEESIVHPDYELGNYDENEQSEVVQHGEFFMENVKHPYLAFTYADGTLCDLTNQPRKTTVQYICYEQGRGDLYQIKETSTCEYTATVLVGELCNHPKYKPIREKSKIISCHSLDGAPEKPQMVLDIDNILSQKPQKISPPKGSSVVTITKAEQEAKRTGIGKREDNLFLQRFLSGEHCLQGAAGWWSYELCYGKTAKQFHVEAGKRVTNILLGKWDLDAHLTWISKHPSKNMNKHNTRRYISQFYSEGDFCDEIKAKRTVEVKLKCTQMGGSSHAVAIYLVEPSTCQYILTVESPILCDLVDQADDKGLVS